MRRIVLGIIIACMGLIAALMVTPSAQAQLASPAIYLIPHQDDDVLSFGADMRNHVEAGRQVIAVLLTDGSSSGICDVNKDGTKSSSERIACTSQRDAEFKAAMNQIGVQPVIRVDRKQDGSLTSAYVQSVILQLKAAYTTSGDQPSFKGQTYKESNYAQGHADHDAIGEAMKSLWLSGAITDVRFFVKPDLWDNVSQSIQKRVAQNNINGALNRYGSHAPDAGTIVAPGVGQRSSNTFCEQYGGAGSEPTSLYGGKLCNDPLYPQYLGGADSFYHLPGV